MKKRLIGFALIVCLLLSLLSVGTLAAGEVASGTCGDGVTWTLDSAGKLTIRGSGPMENYSKTEDEPWNEYRGEIKEVVIDSGVTTVGAYAFSQCSALESISIPASVNILATNAFRACAKIKSVTLPDGLTTIATYAFCDCTSLKDVSLPASLVTIAFCAFRNCTALSGITLPENLVSLGSAVFKDCVSLQTVSIPEKVTVLNSQLFEGCFALKKIELPASVSNINDNSFNNCTSLTSVKLRGSMPAIAANAFNGVTAAVFYPTGDSSYTADKKLGYGGTLVWPGEEAFTDVAAGEYFYVPVYWAFDKGITTGKTATTFDPYGPCTRSQIVTFIWRMLGQPAPASNVNPFSDVKESDYFFTAVLWAYHGGITTGKTATTFGSYQPCTREQCVTFLWRASGRPGIAVGSRFTDVKSGAYYAEPVYWALNNGVTTGQTATTFGVGKTCTRGQIVTFLYRYAKLTGTE